MALPKRQLAAPRCNRCNDSKLVQCASGWIRCAWCHELTAEEYDEDARTEYEIDRAEERASRVFGGAREDWGHTW